MGLDTSHDCWHGSYSAFNDFRVDIARALGFDLNTMEGFSEREHQGTRTWESLPVPNDPLYVLLLHSDCDGEIAVKHLVPLAERLEQIAPSLTHKWMSEAARAFAAGCRRAAAAKQPVKFH